MNELQQVLLIFAVVVIAGLYFLSRSRQKAIKKNAKSNSESQSHASETSNPTTIVQNEDVESASNKGSEKAAEALNNLGNPHIPLSESTEQRITQGKGFSNSDLQQSVVNSQASFNNLEEQNLNLESASIPNAENEFDINRNQGVLSFGEEFDVPKGSNESTDSSSLEPQLESEVQLTRSEAFSPSVSVVNEDASTDDQNGGKHHVLVVDDPGMTGEVDESSASSDFIKPSFGIPEEELTAKKKMVSTNKEPEVYVIMVLSTGQEFPMKAVNQALLGVGLSYSEQAIFVKKDNMGNPFIKVANMLEPGTFPVENLDEYATPGIAMILELPTTVRAPAAMHDLIMMARKISQRLQGRLYDMDKHLIKESDLQSMRDAALDYESEPIA